MNIFGLTNIGLKRSLNEDNYFIYTDNERFIAAVSDGMGGHNAGEVASKIVVDSLTAFIEKTDLFSNPEINMKKVVSYCNQNVFNHACENKSLMGMGATLVLAVYDNETLTIANIGDSRAYLCSHDEIKQITEDHSFVFELLKSGVITEEEAHNHPQRNEITKAIGIVPEVFPDVFSITVQKGESLLLCSDGLSNMLDNHKIKEIISNNSNVEASVNTLIDNANLNGGTDNITAVLAEF